MRFFAAFFLTFMLTLSTQLSAQDTSTKGTRFYYGSYDHFVEKAKEEGKPFMVAFHTSWCEPCKRMEATVYPDRALAQYIKDNYLAMKVDAESEAYKSLAEAHFITNYPTILILNANGEELARLNGYQDEVSLLEELKKYVPGAVNLRFSAYR